MKFRIGIGTMLFRPKLGPELIVNQDFATDTWWVKFGLATISGGTGNANLTDAAEIFRAVGILEALKSYHVIYTVKIYVSGTCAVRLGTVYGTNRIADGTYEEDITSNSANFSFYARSVPGDFSVDDVSVKENL